MQKENSPVSSYVQKQAPGYLTLKAWGTCAMASTQTTNKPRQAGYDKTESHTGSILQTLLPLELGQWAWSSQQENGSRESHGDEFK